MTIVTPPVPANNLLALVGADTPVGYQTFGGLMYVDFANDVAYFVEEGTPATGDAGIKKLSIGTSGTETLQATETDIFGAGPAHTLGLGEGCYHPNGNIYIDADGGNSSPIAIIDAATLVSSAVIGLSNSSFSNSTNNDGGDQRFLSSFQMVALQAGDNDYIVSRGIRSVGKENEVGVFKVTDSTIFVIWAADITENLARICAANSSPSNSVSTFFVLGDMFTRGLGDPTPITFYEYRVHADAVGAATIGTLAPTDIDPTWTNFATVSNPGYDSADGNMLCFFQTLDSVTTTQYLAKISATDGSVMWATPVTNQANLPNCNINGTLGIFNGNGAVARTLDLVDLSDGSITSQSWNQGFSAIGVQVWDYVSGSLAGNLSYSPSTGPVPTYLGAYLAANSDTIPGSRWGRLFAGQTYVENSSPTPPADSAPQRAWTYTLDGHTFYVLDLDDEGTFVFDFVTQHWSKFVTTSTTPLWNMSNGTMWNGRVIAGDRTSNKLWELDPNATLDNGTDEITRVITALVSRRSRNYISIGALRVACSQGVLSGSGDSTLNLRFSDDQGNTWSTTFTVPLGSGAFGGEIAFRSLGSFAAPGRLFELSDTGGLVRIACATIDPELDEDAQQQA